MNSKDILSKVFEITRDPRDGLHFLEEFKSLSPESFAVLFADVNTILESSEALFSDIKLLSKLELFPVLVLEEESIQYLSLFFPTDNNLATNGIGFPFSVITYYTNLLIDVKESIAHKKIPILIWNKGSIEFADFVFEIIESLHSNKFIQLHHEGPIYDEDTGKVISHIPTGEKLNSFKSNAVLSESDRDIHFLKLAETLVEKRRETKFSAVLTSPYTLLRELFTIKGSGTLVRKENHISKIKNMESVDKERLFSLIENSFRKKLKKEFKTSNFDTLYLEEEYQACAWLNRSHLGYILSKFAVNETARGAGVGRDIWDSITEEALPLFWRSKPDNNINKWYMKVAQGIEKDEQWYYYWLGMDQEKIPEVIRYLKSQPEDFENLSEK